LDEISDNDSKLKLSIGSEMRSGIVFKPNGTSEQQKMEELENKTFLIKVRSELFEYLKSENKHEKVGKLKVFLNKKRNKPEFIFHFNKKEEPKTFSLSYNKTNDFLYFGDKETKEGFKVGNVDNFGNLIINEEEIADELIKDAYNLEKNKREIKVREVKDGEKRYVQHEEIKLSGNQFIERDKKEKKIRIDNEKLKGFIKDEVKKNNYPFEYNKANNFVGSFTNL